MQELLLTTLQGVIAVAVPLLTGYAIRWLNAQTEQVKAKASNETAERYILEAADAVETAVLHTMQTYSDTLKKSGAFTVENQREAFNLALAEARSLLTADAKRFINEAYGDVTKYLTTKIEAEVMAQK